MPGTRRIQLIGILFFALTQVSGVGAEDNRFDALRIAHAGGGLGNMTYTDSYQALSANLRKGFKYFEIDFSFTSDDQLVCLHDWGFNFKKTFGFETKQRLSLAEFERVARENKKFTNCTLQGLADWMLENPAAYIVTDVKDNNLKALKRIHATIPDANNRVIPQIYDPLNFDAVSSMGFRQLIWTLYRYPGNGYEVIQWVEKWQAKLAVTMPKNRAASALPGALGERGIATYVHTVNKPDEMNRFINVFGVTEIYTDFLVPR